MWKNLRTSEAVSFTKERSHRESFCFNDVGENPFREEKVVSLEETRRRPLTLWLPECTSCSL